MGVRGRGGAGALGHGLPKPFSGGRGAGVYGAEAVAVVAGKKGLASRRCRPWRKSWQRWGRWREAEPTRTLTPSMPLHPLPSLPAVHVPLQPLASLPSLRYRSIGSCDGLRWWGWEKIARRGRCRRIQSCMQQPLWDTMPLRDTRLGRPLGQRLHATTSRGPHDSKLLQLLLLLLDVSRSGRTLAQRLHAATSRLPSGHLRGLLPVSHIPMPSIYSHQTYSRQATSPWPRNASCLSMHCTGRCTFQRAAVTGLILANSGLSSCRWPSFSAQSDSLDFSSPTHCETQAKACN